MGNCLFGGTGEEDTGIVKVITPTGGIMEFCSPVTVDGITDEFPGHAIFKSHDLFWNPIPHQQLLLAGNSYYLLPFNKETTSINQGHVRSNSGPPSAAPYRMSFDNRAVVKLKRSYTSEGYCRNRHYRTRSGFWKVKLVITPEQLLEILSQEGKTEELIENVRTVAKCGNSVPSSSVAFSDQWSRCSSSSSRNTSKKERREYISDVERAC